MDSDNDNRNIHCFKIPHKILRCLNISHDNTDIVLWSKCQIIVYKNANFNSNPIILSPTFEIESLLIHNNHILCLDCSGNMNISSIDSNIFRICNGNVTDCEIINIIIFKLQTKYVLSLQFKENSAEVFINEFNLEFDFVNKFKLNFSGENLAGIKYNIVCDIIRPEHLKKIKDIFNITYDPEYLLIISLDKRNVYACFLGKTEHITIISKLYKSHTEIISVQTTNEACILLGLAGGNIIKISLINRNWKPVPYHLNTALYKFSLLGNDAIYTDGLTMWRKENIFSKTNDIIDQFLVKNVRDFCILRKQIICITFSNLIYSFNIDHRSSYLKANKHCTAEVLTTSEHYLTKIMDLVQKNDELIRKTNKESEYLTALALSNRQDVMDDLIQVTASVFDDYHDLTLENIDLTLTDELNNYYDVHSYYFLIKISVATIQHKLNKLLSDVLGDIKVHIILFANEVLKTTSIEIREQFRSTNFVIPLKRSNCNISKVQVYVKIITNIPTFDKNQRELITLYRKSIVLNAEHFIKTANLTNCTLLKHEIPLETLISKKTNHLHSTMNKLNLLDDKKYEWSSYVKLPKKHIPLKDILTSHKGSLSSKKLNVIFKHFGDFSKSKNRLEFDVDKEKVTVSIEEDDAKTHNNMIISCLDISAMLDIRNFYSNIFLNYVRDTKPGTEFVNHKYYTLIEELRRDIGMKKKMTNEELVKVLTYFYKVIYGQLPL